MFCEVAVTKQCRVSDEEHTLLYTFLCKSHTKYRGAINKSPYKYSWLIPPRGPGG